MREDHVTHGVRDGFPPKGGKPDPLTAGSRSDGLIVIETPILLDGEASELWTWEADDLGCPITGGGR